MIGEIERREERVDRGNLKFWERPNRSGRNENEKNGMKKRKKK